MRVLSLTVGVLLSVLPGFAIAAERNFSIGGQPFAVSEIVDARALPELDGTTVVMITFSEGGARKLKSLTAALLGKEMPFILDGKTLASPIVTEAVVEDTAQIAGVGGLKDAEQLAKLISGKPPLPDSLDE